MAKRLGIGMVGSGFNAKFHMQGFVGVRDADVLGVWSPNATNAATTAGVAKKLGVGDAKPYPSIAAMVEDPAIDAIWLSGPNHARIENVEEMVSTIERGKGTLKASPVRSRSRATSRKRSASWSSSQRSAWRTAIWRT